MKKNWPFIVTGGLLVVALCGAFPTDPPVLSGSSATEVTAKPSPRPPRAPVAQVPCVAQTPPPRVKLRARAPMALLARPALAALPSLRTPLPARLAWRGLPVLSGTLAIAPHARLPFLSGSFDDMPFAPAEPQTEDARKYQAVYSLIMEEEWEEAGKALDEFLTAYPKSSWADFSTSSPLR